jgi:O-antigen ligase
MKSQAQAEGNPATKFSPTLAERVPEPRWSLALVGLLLYALVEYTSLTAMYPALAVLRPGKIAIGLAAIGYLLGPKGHTHRDPAARGIDIAIILFTICAFLSACFANETTEVWDHFSDVLIWLMIYFLTSRILSSSWRLRSFLFFVLLLNLKLAQFTLRQYVMFRGAGATDMQIIKGGGPAVGSSAFFGNAADLGVAMAVVWGLTFALLLGKAEKKTLFRIYLLICFTFFLVAVLLCGSRGAVVGAAAIALVSLAKTPKKMGAIFLALVFLCSLWFVLPDATKERFQSAWDWQNDANAASRIHFWKVGLQMFVDHPIVGVGPGNFPEAYAYEYGGVVQYVAHSTYIQALSESGLLGTICLALLIFLFLRLNARTRKSALASIPGGKHSFQYCLAVGLDLALVGYLASGAFVSVLYYPHLWILLGLSVAANAACTSRQSQSSVGSETAAVRKMAFATS